MKYIKYLFVGTVFSMFLTGCLQVNTTVNLNKDGSGTIEETVIMKDAVINMVKEFAASFDSTNSEEFEMFKEDELISKAKNYGDGVKYLSGEKVKVKGYQGFKAVYSFSDINKIKINPSPENKVPFGDDLGEDETATMDDLLKFDFNKGNPSTLVINFPKHEEDKSEAEETNEESTEFEDSTFTEETEQKMIEMFDGMKINVSFNFNNSIKETDASFVDGNKITLLEVDFSEVIKHKDVLEKLQNSKPETMEQFKEVIGDLPGIKVEFKEKVTIKF